MKCTIHVIETMDNAKFIWVIEKDPLTDLWKGFVLVMFRNHALNKIRSCRIVNTQNTLVVKSLIVFGPVKSYWIFHFLIPFTSFIIGREHDVVYATIQVFGNRD